MTTDNKYLDISLLKPSELLDEAGDYIDIWKQESFDDEYLMEYFYETPSFDELCKTKKYIVTGRKGTGKTALRKAFIKRCSSPEKYYVDDIDAAKLFTPTFFNSIQDLLANDYREITKSYVDKLGWMLLIRWIIALLRNNTFINDDTFAQDNQLPEKDQNILRQILELNGYIDLGDIGTESLQLKTVKTTRELLAELSYDPAKVAFSNKTEKQYENKATEVNFENIKPYIENYLIDMLSRSGKKFYMLIDGFDKIRNYAEDTIYKKIITDFLLAVVAFNENISKVMNNGSRVILFLRNDIFDLIEGDYDDMGKLRGDYRISIDWQSDHQEEDGLLNRMINKRLEAGIKIRNKESEGVIFYNKPLMQNVLNNSKVMLPYHQKAPPRLRNEAGKLSVQRFLYNRTLLRPRDYVQFFGLLSKSGSIENFEKEYSNYFKSQTLDEIKKVVTNFDRTEKVLEKICRGGTGRFKGEFFINEYSRGVVESQKYISEAKITLKLLYQYGVIAYVEKSPHLNVPERVRFFHRETDTKAFNYENCILHSGLYRAYGIQ